MKRILTHRKTCFGPALLMALLLMSLIGCSDAGSTGNHSGMASPNDTMPPNSRAFKMLQDGRPYEEYMPVQLEAVAQLRDGHPQSDAISILSQTGHFLMRHGNYIEALEYLQEASDSADIRIRQGRNDISFLRMYSNISAIYSRFGLMDDALAENAKAMEVSKMNGFKDAVDLWRMRGAIFSQFIEGSDRETEFADSALYCIERAYGFISEAPEEYRRLHLNKCNFDKACLFVENAELFADSIAAAINLLTGIENEGSLVSSINVALGRAYVISGNYKEGVEMQERGLNEHRKQNWKENIQYSLRLLAKSYAEAGYNDRLAAIYPELVTVEADMMNQAKINALVGADFKYRVREKQHQLDELRAKNKRSNKIIIFGGVVLLIGLVAGMALAVTYIKLKTKSRREKQSHEKEIADILSKHVMLNSRIEQLNEQLQKKENDEVIDRLTEQINPALLSGEDETKFRRAFMSLHPHFLKKLRREYPALTSGDELLCMLIYLKVPSIDMAASLGISRASLNSARYRLRKRLSLDKDTDLDIFLQSQ